MKIMKPPVCERAPVGWRCTRDWRHTGPCAAVPEPFPLGAALYVALVGVFILALIWYSW